MKINVYSSWDKGEAWRLFPNIEIYNNPDNIWICLCFCKWNASLEITPDYEKR